MHNCIFLYNFNFAKRSSPNSMTFIETHWTQEKLANNTTLYTIYTQWYTYIPPLSVIIKWVEIELMF